jgi:hypothetical protein
MGVKLPYGSTTLELVGDSSTQEQIQVRSSNKFPICLKLNVAAADPCHFPQHVVCMFSYCLNWNLLLETIVLAHKFSGGTDESRNFHFNLQQYCNSCI